MNRILLYVHFNKNDALSEYVLYQLKELRPLFDNVVFMSNSKLSNHDKHKIGAICNDVILRNNVGFDFAAWRDGLLFVGWKELSKYNNVTLMNDSCFGPVYPMKNVYEKMEKSGVDFWGITDHAASDTGMPGTNGPVPHHIQSYLTAFSTEVVLSKVFQSFWSNVKDYDDVEKVIQDYETKLTGILTREKFSWQVYFDTKSYSAKQNIKTYNYSELLPLVTIENGVPLLKIKAFIHTPPSLIFYHLRKTRYPTALIKMHLYAIDLKSISYLKYRLKKAHLLLRGCFKMIYNKANEN